MAAAARQRAGAIAGVVLGPAVGSLRSQPPQCDSRDADAAWASSYLARAVGEPAIIGDRKVMNASYVADVQRLQACARTCSSHPPLLTQPAYQHGGRATLRILTWNINILCGPDGSASVGGLRRIDPDLVANVIKDSQADVVCLQETLDWLPPKYRDYLEKQGVGDVDERMQRLNRCLEEQGYHSMLRSCSPPSLGNPVLVASKIPFLSSETLELAAPEAKANGMGSPRCAAYVELGITADSGTAVGLYATHLNHINHSLHEGQRAAEIRSLLLHSSARPAGHPARLGTALLGDLNQPRQQDYTGTEWQIVEAGLRGVKQPLDDGVSGLLQNSGFVCAYDANPPPVTNFGGNRSAPPFTHWTGTTVDYLYLQSEQPAMASVTRAHVLPSDLSDHLPILFDLTLSLPAPSVSSKL